DMRVSIIPTLYGEGVVLRILDNSGLGRGLGEVGMSPPHAKTFQELLDLPHGIFLVTGPTGSGKSTTLYAGLQTVDRKSLKVITVEDPVEYRLQGVAQIQVKEKIGLTFARGLRSILRHDPDVVMIGEIRDRETAEIAVQASLTGHLVLSTLHTNDAAGAITRLIDMGVEPYLISSSVVGILAQRLVRSICTTCKVDVSLTEAQHEDFKLDLDHVSTGRGCVDCRRTGYRGRLGIFEILVMDDTVRVMVTKRTAAGVIKQQCIAGGMLTLRDDG